MDSEWSSGTWLAVGVLAFLGYWFLFTLLVVLPGRFIIYHLTGDEDPSRRKSRAVGLGLWTFIVATIYALVN